MCDLAELQAVFRAEGQELLERLLTGFDALSRTTGAAARDEILKAARRILHNIKGTASCVGLHEVEELSHAIEDLVARPDLFAAPRAGDLSTIVEALEQMRLVLQEKSPAASLSAHLDGLRALAPATPSVATATVPDAPPTVPVESVAPPRSETTDSAADDASMDVPARAAATIRIEVERLDNALATSNELITATARLKAGSAILQAFLKDLVAEAEEHGRDAEWSAPLLARARAIARDDQRQTTEAQRLVGDLGEAMKAIRMVPLHRLDSAWRGIVREAALACDKKVQLTIDTGDIELDRDILEALQDPMMHLLRNAVDHGIEPPAERLALHKPDGRVVIAATTKGTMVELEVSDDGRGLDYERIRQLAVQRGLVGADHAHSLAPQSLAEYIFAAGFSTAERVSNLSGRGVGLDVVRNAVESLGGAVAVRSEPASGGSTFTLTLPASRIATAGLFVRSGRTECAVPLSAIERVVRLRRQQMQEVGGQMLVRIDGVGPVRLIDLARVLGPAAAKAAAYIVIVARGSRRVGLLADEVLGEDVFVSTSLPWNMVSISAVAGAIRRPNGSLALAIDVAQLFAIAESGTAASTSTAVAKATAPRRVLVADDALAIRVFEENLLYEAGYQVTLAADGEQAWALLERESFDLVISDVEMPSLDGLELTRRIRASDKLRDLPVVLVSNRARPEDRAAGAAAGADDYLVKGTFERHDLLAMVRRFLGGATA